MQAKLIQRNFITPQTLQVQFELLEEELNFQAGQYIILELINPPFTDDKPNKRVFSIVNSPAEKKRITIATRMSESAFKKSLHTLSLGALVTITRVGGTFVLPPPDRPLVFIAGGIGITPFMSMLGWIGDCGFTGYDITLFYSNRSLESTAYLPQLQALEKQIPSFKLIAIMTNDSNWKGENRPIQESLIKDYASNFQPCLFMMVGPPVMVQGAQQVLQHLNISSDQIILEKFMGY